MLLQQIRGASKIIFTNAIQKSLGVVYVKTIEALNSWRLSILVLNSEQKLLKTFIDKKVMKK